ncbi:microtubule nucleation factor SSNA1 [Diceros bicornis minor]|uniref:Sjoegren syndrome nuclear autoantigen 1 n=1 Tax=Diceros bicornis minor TaxID=77932 RepID=A0A7J7FGF0_DICBM|nr:microtubule nucleation factor SSNA1 [Diceros bicornis minor]KAF5927100.1 hypothetical protein HPG69_009848 [Diceros bicornis minor]
MTEEGAEPLTEEGAATMTEEGAATMTEQGAAMQDYNNQLIKGMEVLCQRRNKLCRQIQKEEKEKQRLHNQLRRLTEKLALVNENLACKIASYKELDRTITESEAAFFKILESSQALLSVVKREAGNLSKVMASEQEIIEEKDSS